MSTTESTLVPTRVALTIQQRQALESAARQQRSSVAAVVRQAIDAFVSGIPNQEVNRGND